MAEQKRKPRARRKNAKAKVSPASLGKAIQEQRAEAGLTQKQLAEASDIHVTYLSGLENGHRNPSLSVIATVAQKLGVKLSDLFERAEKQKK